MGSPPVDDSEPLGGVWVGHGPPPSGSRPPAPDSAPRRFLGRLGLINILGVAGSLYGAMAGPGLLGPLLGFAVGVTLGMAWALLTPPPSKPAPPPRAADPIPVVYTPAPPQGPVGLALDPLEEELLALCQQDAALFDRLVEHERELHPHIARSELIRLAIDHFRRDRL